MIIPPIDSLIEGQSDKGHRYVGHTHFWERAMLSRRQFIRTSAGATGAVLSSGLWLPAVAHANKSRHVAPRPIPGGTQILGPGTEVFHVFEPVRGNEPSTIFDFKGVVGVAHIQGTGTGTNTRTGTSTTLLFDVDNRFMKGIYIGVDGKKHTGTFGFIWLDLFEGQFALANEIHDYNPGISSSGLFWTIHIPDKSVEIDLDKATASMDMSNLETRDFHDIVNTLNRGPSVPVEVSFHIRWSGVTDRIQIRDEKNQFVGNFIEDTATVDWSSKQKGFEFVSDPASTSTSIFAEIGRERNGVFFS